MRTLLLLLVTMVAASWTMRAQEAAAKPAEKQPAATEAAAAKPEEKAAAPAESPAPDAEQAFTGSITLGYRWNGDIRGNLNVYRSIVNLGEGVRLIDMDLSIRQANKLFDRLDLRANSWGGDPYNNAYLDVRKNKYYRLTGTYRNIDYFNNLPSFANPFLANGVTFSQRTYDTHRRLLDFDLDLAPGSRFVPYFAVSRSAGSGTGVIGFYTNQAEYPVRNNLSDEANNYRAGLRVELPRLHVTFEQGYITFADDQLAYTQNRNLGNRSTPYAGQTLFLANLNQQYGVRGSSPYTQALFTANPTNWLDLRGAILYSRPQTHVNYDQSNAGLFVLPGGVGTYTNQKDLITGGEANLPRTSGDLGFEIRPFSRIRVLGSWSATQYQISSSALLLEQLLTNGTAAAPSAETPLGSSLTYHYNQEQVDVLYDVTRKVTARVGQRFVWGEAYTRAGDVSPVPQERGELRQNVGLFGVNVRPTTALSANVDAEIANSDRTYFRASLKNYQKVRIRARYQLTGTVQLGVNSWITHNSNPAIDTKYDYSYYADSLNLGWHPSKTKWMGVTGEYMYSTLKSDLSYLEPQLLTRVSSLYREHGHTASGLLDLTLPKIVNQAPTLSFGGSFFSVGGTRPTDFFQPVGRLMVPMHKQIQALAEWRWWGYNESLYGMEGFRDHQITFGIRWVRQ